LSRRISLRLLTLTGSVGWRHLGEDPVRAATLAWRILPRPGRRMVRRVSGYGRALALWDRGDRQEALRLLAPSPQRQASFALAMDRPEVARAALDRAGTVPVCLAARLAWREGRLTDAMRMLDGARSSRARRMRRAVAGELAVLDPGNLTQERAAQHKTASHSAEPHRAAPHSAESHSAESHSAESHSAESHSAESHRAAPHRAEPHRAEPHRAAPGPARVLHIVTNALPSTHAGYTVRTHHIAIAQRAAGLEPHVVTKCGFPVAQGIPDARGLVEVDGIPYHRLLPYVLPRTADAVLRRGSELAERLSRQLRPAVLHAASNHLNGQVALTVGERCGLPVVYEARGFLEETWLSRRGEGSGSSQTDMYRLSRAMETACMRAAGLVVTLGEVMREEIIGRGIPPEKVVVVPNAVSAEFLEPLPDGHGLRESLGIGPAEFTIGMVSSLFAYEGGANLLEAVAELRRRRVPARPLIVGDGPERGALERLAAELGLDGVAIFTGRVPIREVRQYHAVLDVFAVPRTDDRVCHLVTPLKPVEAMASGLAVVASDVKAMREIIEPGTTGTLTVPEDSMKLADCIEGLFYTPDRRRAIGACARDWVARDRTWARNADRYLSAYRSLGAI
jgi:glycosyltransferase involved in cell wall biosynthesis